MEDAKAEAAFRCVGQVEVCPFEKKQNEKNNKLFFISQTLRHKSLTC